MRFRADASPSGHGLLISSPQAEPSVQISCTGLPRCHSRVRALVRSWDAGWQETAARTTGESSDSPTSRGGAGHPGDLRRVSTEAVFGAAPTGVWAHNGEARNTDRSLEASSSDAPAAPIADSVGVPRSTPARVPGTSDNSWYWGYGSGRSAPIGPPPRHV